MKNNIVKEPFVSIIVPLHWGLKKENFDRFVREINDRYLTVNYSNYEIILVTEKKVSLPFVSKKVKHLVINRRKTSPAEKRDFALKFAKGTICAFIDDDAYPQPDWIKNAVDWFNVPNIVAVGGPGVTPPEDSYWQKVGGYILDSYFGSGDLRKRFSPRGKQFVKDHPAYNFFARTKDLKKVGGWGSTFYGGEDTLLCIKLSEYGDILSSEDVIVYHHRRSFPLSHLKQNANVGLHRGYFFKRFPQTSRKLIYILPSLLALGFFGGIVASAIDPNNFLIPFSSLFLIIFLFGNILTFRSSNLFTSFIVTLGIILTHITYGIFFIKGMALRRLEM